MTVDEARRALLDLMETISEDGYCAGWMAEIETELWLYVENGGGEYGMHVVTPGAAAELRRLAEIGGWPKTRFGSDDKTVWLPASEMSAYCAKRREELFGPKWLVTGNKVYRFPPVPAAPEKPMTVGPCRDCGVFHGGCLLCDSVAAELAQRGHRASCRYAATTKPWPVTIVHGPEFRPTRIALFEGEHCIAAGTPEAMLAAVRLLEL